jgi:hypothetical protein
MVDYRSFLDDYSREHIMKKYSKHVDSYGGLFTRTMRQNLLGINPKNDLPYNYTANFWSDVRKSVKNGLVDIQMICAIASFSQIEKMFEHTLDYPNQGKGGEVSVEDYYALSTNLISAFSSILSVNASNDPKQRAMKIELEKKRKELEQTTIIVLDEKRRKLVLERIKLDERLEKNKDDKTLFEKKKIENEIEQINSEIEIAKKPINLLNSKIFKNDPKLRLWQAKLAKLMVSECFYFLIKNHFIQSPGYEDDLNKVNLIINSELSRYN